jgi:hypothetical protein
LLSTPSGNNSFTFYLYTQFVSLYFIFTSQIRQNVLIQAFLRSLRDPFYHARIAGILSLSATQNFYSLKDTATKVMPALCHMTMDPEKSVRDQAFRALKKFITKVEKVSEDPSLLEKMGKRLVFSFNQRAT